MSLESPTEDGWRLDRRHVVWRIVPLLWADNREICHGSDLLRVKKNKYLYFLTDLWRTRNPPKIHTYHFFSLVKITSTTTSSFFTANAVSCECVTLTVLTFKRLWLGTNSLLHVFKLFIYLFKWQKVEATFQQNYWRFCPAVISLIQLPAKNSFYSNRILKKIGQGVRTRLSYWSSSRWANPVGWCGSRWTCKHLLSP